MDVILAVGIMKLIQNITYNSAVEKITAIRGRLEK